ncbi:MAG TPA: hypothetical protein VJP79_03075 [Nitrososphaera sp.]|nr:hypothetical protein [Nitrososphaera sp.]
MPSSLSSPSSATTTASSLLEVFDVESSSQSPPLPRQFLICDYCFWAASAIGSRRREVVTCPKCEQQLSKIPLGNNERFTFSREKERGVELSFTSAR